ncbi:transposase family protein [Streptomyces sp. NPDC002596]
MFDHRPCRRRDPPAAGRARIRGARRPGLRLRTLEDVFAYSEAEDVTLRIDGTETQVRRPWANRPGRRAVISGKRRQNTIKTTTISDHQGRALFSGAQRPGRMRDQTALRTEGIAEQLRQHPTVRAEVDEGYRGLANEFPEQVSAPQRKPRDLDNAPLSERADTDPARVPRMALPPRAHGARVGVRERACVIRWCVALWPL